MSFELLISENIVMLTLLGVGFYAIESARGTIKPIYFPLLHGMSFGLIAFLVTSTPVSISEGATLDARAGPVIMAGVVAGPVAAFIAAGLGGLARGLIGGPFAFPGVFVYLVYAMIGTAVWGLLARRKLHYLNPRIIALVVILSCCGAALMFFLITPIERAVSWRQQALPWIMLANTLAIFLRQS